MKKYLYEIDDAAGWHIQNVPFLPRTMAQKVVKEINKMLERKYGHRQFDYSVSKTTLVIKGRKSYNSTR